MDDNIQLPDSAPEEIKIAQKEYIRLGEEQEEFALSL